MTSLKFNLKKLQRVQHSLARIVLKCHHPFRSSNGSLSELHWLPIHHRINFKHATLTFKAAISSQQPPHLSSLLHPYLSESAHTSSPCHTHSDSKPSYVNLLLALSVSNSIPIKIRSSPSLYLPWKPSKILFLYPLLVVYIVVLLL